MRLTVLGSGTGWFTSERCAPGYLVSQEDFHLLLDLGPGTLRQLLKLNLTLNEVSALFISHFHPDHVTDLIPFLFATRYNLGYFRKEKVKLIAHQKFSEFYEGLKKAFGHWVEPQEGLLYWQLIENEGLFSFQIGPFKAQTIKVNHNPESLALRLEFMGKSLIYSGDTGFCEELIELAQEGDLLVLECANSREYKVPIHLGPEEISLICEKARPKKLLLSHFYPHSEEVNLAIIQERFQGEIILGRDLLTLEL